MANHPEPDPDFLEALNKIGEKDPVCLNEERKAQGAILHNVNQGYSWCDACGRTYNMGEYAQYMQRSQ